jgi:DNA-binding LytR/AlgR family response regulator
MENYVIIHTALKKVITHSTLKALIEKLPGQTFMQTHKSFVVSLGKVNTIEGNMLHIGQHRVPIGRQLKDDVMNRIIGL